MKSSCLGFAIVRKSNLVSSSGKCGEPPGRKPEIAKVEDQRESLKTLKKKKKKVQKRQKLGGRGGHNLSFLWQFINY